MPIMAEHRWLYPIDWPELSRLIRFGRAKGRCEHCQRPHGRRQPAEQAQPHPDERVTEQTRLRGELHPQARGARQHLRDQPVHHRTERQPQCGADQSDRAGLGDHHPHDTATGRAECAQDPDFAATLEHREQQRVRQRHGRDQRHLHEAEQGIETHHRRRQDAVGSDGLELSQDQVRTMTVRETIGSLPPIKAGERDPQDELHTASSLSPLNLSRIRVSRPGGTWRDWPEELQASCHRKDTGATYPSVYGRMEWDRPAPTITTQCFGYGNGRFGHPEQDRAISLREAAMLQTFPESYAFAPPGAPIKFNKMGRLIGNAVPVRLGEVIARSLVGHVQAHVH